MNSVLDAKLDNETMLAMLIMTIAFFALIGAIFWALRVIYYTALELISRYKAHRRRQRDLAFIAKLDKYFKDNFPTEPN